MIDTHNHIDSRSCHPKGVLHPTERPDRSYVKVRRVGRRVGLINNVVWMNEAVDPSVTEKVNAFRWQRFSLMFLQLTVGYHFAHIHAYLRVGRRVGMRVGERVGGRRVGARVGRRVGVRVGGRKVGARVGARLHARIHQRIVCRNRR